MARESIVKLFVFIFGSSLIVACGHDEDKDKIAPTKPIISSIKSVNGGRIIVQGSAEARSTVRVTFPNKAYKEVTATLSKTYSAKSIKSQSSGDVTAIAIDASGNESLLAKKYYAGPASQTFQLNILDIDIKKSTDDSDLHIGGKVFQGEEVIVK